MRLARLYLSLREGPVFALGTVDEEDLHLAARRVSHDKTARCLDDPLVLCPHVPSMPHRGQDSKNFDARGTPAVTVV